MNSPDDSGRFAHAIPVPIAAIRRSQRRDGPQPASVGFRRPRRDEAAGIRRYADRHAQSRPSVPRVDRPRRRPPVRGSTRRDGDRPSAVGRPRRSSDRRRRGGRNRPADERPRDDMNAPYSTRPRSDGGSPYGDRPRRDRRSAVRFAADARIGAALRRPAASTTLDRPATGRPSATTTVRVQRPAAAGRPTVTAAYNDRPRRDGDRPRSMTARQDRLADDRPADGDRPAYNDRPRRDDDRPCVRRPAARETRPSGVQRPAPPGRRPSGVRRPAAPG